MFGLFAVRNWRYGRGTGEEDENIQISTNTNYYVLQCIEFSLSLYPSTFEKDDNDVTETNRLYNGKLGPTSREYYNNPTRLKSASINSQHKTFAISNIIKTERKCGTIHDGALVHCRDDNFLRY